MQQRNNWWARQFIESVVEATDLYERFTKDRPQNLDDLDKARALHEEWCAAYDLGQITFTEFIEIGKSLPCSQALPYMHRGV